MNSKVIIVVIAMLAIGAGSLVLMRSQRLALHQIEPVPSRVAPEDPHSEPSHNHAALATSVPAYQKISEIENLDPTLPPARFVGKAREAYQAAKEIPKTLAQLPCYCHCDQSFGHKSLHSCFVDEHASQCAVCVDEALLAFQLEKSGKTALQIREQIIEQYSTPH